MDKALVGIRGLVGDVVEDMRANGEPIPEPLAIKAFSGHFLTRVPSELHRKLAIEAAEQGVSLNRLVAIRLSAPGIVSFEPQRSAPGPRQKGRQREMA
jgi:hypothetical protein